ncbi:hypothetical protein GGQ64_001622 [Rhizobium azooxidifex]|uniref:Uncharacterized protein n=1 Tax=Mycoplana azooxidifex TaxID=1636188 RepID=A0A7W6D452_9HYPH|nr:hypothetical protein [Mycoplana azooxidifex]MBB3976433.1 hypothetical protein [Mycoplana azooxidifex]
MEMVMLPRIATPVTVPIPSPPDSATEAAPAAARQQLSPEALVNLRAAVLLRLLEAMMRQIEQGGDKGNAARQLLEILLEAMKALPPREGGDGDATRRLALLIARLPAEMRPAAERLLATVLATAPTRILMEIIRNPAGPDAQRLAQALLAAVNEPGGKPAGPAASQPRFIPGEAQLAAAAANDRQRQRDTSGDSRSLQAALRRLFEGGAEPLSDRPARIGQRSAFAPALPQQQQQVAAASAGKSVEAGTGSSGQPQQRMPEAPLVGRTPATPANTEASRLAADTQEPAAGPDTLNRGRSPIADRGTAAPEAGRASAISTAVPTIAAGREPEGVLRMIAGIVADLTADEALVLRLLLQAPLPELPELPERIALAPSMPDVAEGSEDSAGRLRAANAMPERSTLAAGGEAPGPATTEAANAARPAVAQPQGVAEDKTQAGRPAAAAEDADAPVRPPAMPLPPPLPERAALPPFRDGLAVPFVPYLPAQDDLETQEPRRREPPEDEEETTDTAGENGAGGEQAEDDAEGEAEGYPSEDDTPDMAKRRRKIEDLVAPPDPGFAFYQKLGEYWT